MLRKIGAWIILFLLLVVPFINWRLGAVLWMCAWLVFICQGLFKVHRRCPGKAAFIFRKK